ncbi:MAG TPA: hypothetical protein VMB71_15075 [Acetobacteraceae bacterium]|nr:hypothetical protein [Acetobacteraceae bacterium]
MGELARAAALLARDLQHVPFEPYAWDVFSQRLAATLNGPVILGTVDLATFTPTNIEQVHLPDEAITDYCRHYYNISPWKQWMMQAGQGAVAAGNAINPLPPELYEKTEFYADFLRPNGMHHGISARVMREGSFVTDLAVLRARERGPIEGEELALIRYLTPQVRRALRVKRLLETARLPPGRLLQPSVGVMLADRNGKVLFANPTALERLSEADGITIERGALAAAHGEARSRLRMLLRRIVDGARDAACSGGEMIVPRPNRWPLRVTIVPTPPGDDNFGKVAPAAMLLVRERPAPPVFRNLPMLQARDQGAD